MDTRTSLLDLSIGKKGRIVSFQGGKQMEQKLLNFGIFIGDIVRMDRIAPFDGPLLLTINNREIALGKRIAARVFIEVTE